MSNHPSPEPATEPGTDTNSPSLDEQAALWAARRQDGLTPEEELALQAWLAGGAERGQRLSQLEALWGRLDELDASDVASFRRGPPPAITRQSPRQARWPSWASLARFAPQLAIPGIVALCWAGWPSGPTQAPEPSFVQSFATVKGQQLSTVLPDGSVLKLDTATRLDVALYESHRELVLPEGQAMFEVKPDPQRPFHVQAGPLNITVLGTRFAVRHTRDARLREQASVVVEEGRVRVARRAPQPPSEVDTPDMVLTAGQSVHVDAQGHFSAVSDRSVSSMMAWREGRLLFNDTPLITAIAEFERYADTGLVVSDPAVAELRLHGSFDIRQSAQFKRALPQALAVRLHPRSDGRTEVLAMGARP